MVEPQELPRIMKSTMSPRYPSDHRLPPLPLQPTRRGPKTSRPNHRRSKPFRPASIIPPILTATRRRLTPTIARPGARRYINPPPKTALICYRYTRPIIIIIILNIILTVVTCMALLLHRHRRITAPWNGLNRRAWPIPPQPPKDCTKSQVKVKSANGQKRQIRPAVAAVFLAAKIRTRQQATAIPRRARQTGISRRRTSKTAAAAVLPLSTSFSNPRKTRIRMVPRRWAARRAAAGGWGFSRPHSSISDTRVLPI